MSGEYYFDNEEWINWWGDVELDDEQVNNLIKLIMFNGGDTDVEHIGLKETFPIFTTSWTRRVTKRLLMLITSI